jgi:hypothetical protein
MIVKNERDVLARCLESVRPLIDTWVIVDTGSDDGTPRLITDWFAARGVAGQLHREPWRDFGYNRTRALDHARGRADYVLIMDADDVLEAPPHFTWPALDADAYRLRHRRGDVHYFVERLVRGDQAWRYQGVLHEYLVREGEPRVANLSPELTISSRSEGWRSRAPDKYLRDAALLEEALRDEPDNLRYLFYLGQSYRDAGRPEQALDAYARRAAGVGWAEERFYAQYQVACLRERLGEPIYRCLDAYLEAWRARPCRLEPLYHALRCCRRMSLWSLADALAAEGARQPMPEDILFVEPAVYRWMILDEWAVAQTWLGRWREALALNQRVLAFASEIPAPERARICDNMRLCEERLAQPERSTGYVEQR